MLRYAQVRGALALVHEAREVGPGPAQRRVLLEGLHRLLGAAMTSFGVIRDFRPLRHGKIEQEISTPADSTVRALIASLCARGLKFSLGLQAMIPLLRTSPMVAALRRELLSDKDWYGSESFNEHHRNSGFDDYVYSLRTIGDGVVSAIAVRRGLRDRPFAEEDRNLLEVFHAEMARLQPDCGRGAREASLSPREREVLEWLLKGASEKEVAYGLGLSQHTVHSHTKSIYSAYRVSSRAELLARCLAR